MSQRRLYLCNVITDGIKMCVEKGLSPDAGCSLMADFCRTTGIDEDGLKRNIDIAIQTLSVDYPVLEYVYDVETPYVFTCEYCNTKNMTLTGRYIYCDGALQTYVP